VDDNRGELLTVAEVAERLGRSIEQVRRYLREGKLAGRRIGQQWFVEESALAGGGEKEHRIGEAAAAYVARPFGAGAKAAPEEGHRGVSSREGGRSMEKGRMDKDEIEKLIAEAAALRERIRARLGGDIPMTAGQLMRLEREEH
jgi:excisionase family DNA binding protein